MKWFFCANDGSELNIAIEPNKVITAVNVRPIIISFDSSGI